MDAQRDPGWRSSWTLTSGGPPLIGMSASGLRLLVRTLPQPSPMSVLTTPRSSERDRFTRSLRKSAVRTWVRFAIEATRTRHPPLTRASAEASDSDSPITSAQDGQRHVGTHSRWSEDKGSPVQILGRTSGVCAIWRHPKDPRPCPIRAKAAGCAARLCCSIAGRAVGAWGLCRSNGRSEFVECGGQPEHPGGVDCELVVASA
jgi:hypothetical protein